MIERIVVNSQGSRSGTENHNEFVSREARRMATIKWLHGNGIDTQTGATPIAWRKPPGGSVRYLSVNGRTVASVYLSGGSWVYRLAPDPPTACASIEEAMAEAERAAVVGILRDVASLVQFGVEKSAIG